MKAIPKTTRNKLLLQSNRFCLAMGNKTLCINYNKGTSCKNLGPKGAYCTPNNAGRYFHLCGHDMGGKPCGRKHRASEHK